LSPQNPLALFTPEDSRERQSGAMAADLDELKRHLPAGMTAGNRYPEQAMAMLDDRRRVLDLTRILRATPF